jgi:anaerobic selenocysteine-containing dehydrogenase
VIFSPEIPGPRVPLARDEWEVFTELAARARPDRAALVRFDGTADIRRDIAATIPYYDGIQKLEKAGDQFQYGGPLLCAGWRFATPDGKAHFNPVPIVIRERAAGTFVVSTRRGKQFNSMVQESRDALTGAVREAVLMSPEDAGRLDLSEGDEVVLENEQGTLRGRVHLAPLKPGNLQVHWPEGQVLIAGDAAHRGRQSGIPDYNAVVRVQSAEAWRVREPTAGEPEGVTAGGAVPARRPGDGRRVPPPPPPPSDRPGPTAPPPGAH